MRTWLALNLVNCFLITCAKLQTSICADYLQIGSARAIATMWQSHLATRLLSGGEQSDSNQAD